MAAIQKTAAVLGTGTIGASWISLFLAHGWRVIASDPAADAQDKATRQISKVLPSLLSDSARKDSDYLIKENLSFTSKLSADHYQRADFVQENGPERLPYKRAIFKELDEHTRGDVVLASSSSGLPASSFVTDCKRSPSRVLIGHPFNPPHLIPLVEVVPHAGTSKEAVQSAVKTYTSLGRKPAVIAKETPGFVVNRLQTALVHEAYSLVERGVVSAKDLDTMVSECLALRWAVQGPFLTKVLGGGGGGIEGFKHAVEHTGPANASWQEDMTQHRFEYKPDSIQRLVDSVKSELAELGEVDLEGTRDRFLREVQTLKGNLSSAHPTA